MNDPTEYEDWKTGWDEKNWQRVFCSFPAQAEFTVMTSLLIGSGRESYVEFGGRELRWINPKLGRSAVVILPINDQDHYEQEFQLVLQFLSRLSFETGAPAFVAQRTSHMRRLMPFLMPTRQLFTSYPKDWHPDSGLLPANLDFAMALYREGINSLNESPFYAFLSFYKVIQLAFNETGPQIKTWINSNLTNVFEPDKVAKLQTEKGDVAQDLWKSGRCAIAHTKASPVANPNDVHDFSRISGDMWIAQGLANWAIRTRAGRLGTI